ncbi:cobyric acid synthase [Ruminococcus flavefaciens]|uniref:cobyric acid synthase n=1 Tax=Ruminococcus flavefaciens TaxID=1265 RepID=UPI0026E9853A|nr:cobyric acid synthase [Ruminococcus flavefaciens]
MGKNIMLQGTMSNVGKSFLTAALCRILRQDGYSVAPFKSQNMALNSFITPDGAEIGRAQALQAEAAGIEPSALMNPILLKPTTDVGSQVIVNGKVRGNIRAADYFRHKKELIPDIMTAYNELASQHDIIIIEGAGSPVELNLKADDIVNMGLAELVKSPVLLVGDIDRGGVFAQLIGTLELLENNERDKVKGLVVNKFRGDISLFHDGINILEQRSRKKVAGVIPYIDCDIEDEDSLSEKLNSRAAEGVIDIAVIHLPKISNFTDFDVFGQYDSVSVRYVSRPNELGTPDMIIIPGTKSTIADMEWLRQSRLADRIKDCFKAGVPVFGICGGYQIMGRTISDTVGSECGGSISGLGLLDCATEFTAEKCQAQTKGRFCHIEGFFSCLSGAEFYGYEVHMGVTDDLGKALTTQGGSFCGNAAGCYVHGIFDSAEVSGRLVRALYQCRGLTYSGEAVDRRKYRDIQLDLLADNVRKNLDMELIYRIIEEGV